MLYVWIRIILFSFMPMLTLVLETEIATKKFYASISFPLYIWNPVIHSPFPSTSLPQCTPLFPVLLLPALARIAICSHDILFCTSFCLDIIPWIQGQGAAEGTDQVPAGHSGDVDQKIWTCFCINQYLSLICTSALTVWIV